MATTPTLSTATLALNSHQQLERLEGTHHTLRQICEELVSIQSQAFRESDVLLSEALKPSLQYLFELLDTFPAVGRIFMDRLGMMETRH